MQRNGSPRLVEILNKLARNWQNTKNRYNRRIDKLRTLAETEKDPEASERFEQDAERLDAEYYDHPFPGLVRLVSQATGLKQTALSKAALQEFNGQQKVVKALHSLDEDGTTAALYQKLCGECPEVAKKVFGYDPGSRTEICPTCGNPAPIDKYNSLRCPDCRIYKGTFGELWVDMKTAGPLSNEDAGDEIVCELRHFLRERFGKFDVKGLCQLRDWLVAIHEMTREQVQVAQLSRLVELLGIADRSRKVGRSADKNSGEQAHPEGISEGEKSTPINDISSKPRRRGRKKADYETRQKEAKLAADWARAKEDGVYKPVFAKECGMTVKELDALLDRVYQRKQVSN